MGSFECGEGESQPPITEEINTLILVLYFQHKNRNGYIHFNISCCETIKNKYKHFDVVWAAKKSLFHGFRHSFNIADTATHVVLYVDVVYHSLVSSMILSF